MKKLTLANTYVAFLDILGFKEMIERNQHEKLEIIYEYFILNNFDLFNDSRKAIPKNLFVNSKVEIIVVSDSIIIWTQNDSFDAFINLVTVVTVLFNTFMFKGIPLRGAISMGPLTISKYKNQTNVFGKAITNAYTLEKDQQWSGCLVDEKVIDHTKSCYKHDNSPYEFELNKVLGTLIVEYNVPFKFGKVKSYYTINWPLWFGSSHNLNEDNIFEAFNSFNKTFDTWDVHQKYKNTIEFYKLMRERNNLE